MSLGAADVGAGAGPPGQHPGAVDNWPVAIIGSGVVGTDLMSRIGNGDRRLRVSAMVGTNPHCAWPGRPPQGSRPAQVGLTGC